MLVAVMISSHLVWPCVVLTFGYLLHGHPSAKRALCQINNIVIELFCLQSNCSGKPRLQLRDLLMTESIPYHTLQKATNNLDLRSSVSVTLLSTNPHYSSSKIVLVFYKAVSFLGIKCIRILLNLFL